MNRWVDGWIIIELMNVFSWLESDPRNTSPEVNKGQADFSALLFLLVAVFKSAL